MENLQSSKRKERRMKPIDWVVYVVQALALIAAGVAATFAFLAGHVGSGVVWIVVAVLWAVNIGIRVWSKVRLKK